ncbi:helix-turn-helix domain-containing transcriptional regulator [Pelagerythrobacter marinus]|uniref:helix-turn-helix domain-containing transcriptional regulator n=1 Tax=Pelagerythrobacter marinus TaxID=538382 RepID=UPI003899A330
MCAVARTGGISELAERTAVSSASLAEALGATATPSFDGIRSIMHALGLRLTAQVVE